MTRQWNFTNMSIRLAQLKDLQQSWASDCFNFMTGGLAIGWLNAINELACRIPNGSLGFQPNPTTEL